MWNMRGGKRRKGEKRREEELIVEVAPELCHFHTALEVSCCQDVSNNTERPSPKIKESNVRLLNAVTLSHVDTCCTKHLLAPSLNIDPNSIITFQLSFKIHPLEPILLI